MMLDTEIIIAPGLPDVLLPEREQRRIVAILTQPAATGRAMEVSDRLRGAGLATEVIGLPDRDEAKTVSVVAAVYETMAAIGMGLHDTVVGVGGGAVTDVAGFVAGTWMRGVEVVHFPTTFLAAIDAAVGGKSGVNVAGKNLVGVFWNPSRVVIDTDLLAGLPTGLIRQGMAEAFKAGLVGDPELVAMFRKTGIETPVDDVVSRALAVKTRLVEVDPGDRMERMFLNFGHTIGHAIEYSSPLSHGESVALGMVASVAVSERLENFGEADMVVDTLEAMGLPVTIGGLDRTRVHDLVSRDKKRDERGVRMVLLRAVGEPVMRHVDEEEIDHGLRAIGLGDG